MAGQSLELSLVAVPQLAVTTASILRFEADLAPAYCPVIRRCLGTHQSCDGVLPAIQHISAVHTVLF